MKKQPKRYLVTAALPYANGSKHIGHLAGAYLPADVYVRYLRLCRRDVIFVCGSDEHGTAIPNQALKEKTTSQAIIDKYHALNRDCFYELGISFDIYHRTSDQIHHHMSQELFLTLHTKGVLNQEESEQYFDKKANTFLADRYIIGTCPICAHTRAYGDQCENCGNTLTPRELINPHSTLSGNSPILKSTKHWYLPLQVQEEWLREWILTNHKADWKSNVYGQCKSWLEAGLQSRAITRDLEWGIKVPLPDAEGKVIYVWFDAPIGYISATKVLFEELSSHTLHYATPQRSFPKSTPDDWKKYWCDKETSLVHFIGKDNIVFHCIIFPVILKLSGQYILPDQVPANEFMNLEGNKMSTSQGWSIEMKEYIEDFPDRPDVLRYVLLANLPEAKDSEFTWKDFQAKNNNELVAIFGNFINRTLTLTSKYFNNTVPYINTLLPVDKALIAQLITYPDRIGQSIESFRFREAMTLCMDLARIGNKYLTETEPWKVEHDEKRLGTILAVALRVSVCLSITTEPFLPQISRRLKSMLNIDECTWQQAGTKELSGGHVLGDFSLLFQKFSDEEVSHQIKKLTHTKTINTKPKPMDIKPEITYDQFTKMDIRIGRVEQAEKVNRSTKLLKLHICIGEETRVVMSGVAEYYSPDELIGKQVMLLLNLKPRVIMGVESQGMVLMAKGEDGKLVLIQPDQLVSEGAIVD